MLKKKTSVLLFLVENFMPCSLPCSSFASVLFFLACFLCLCLFRRSKRLRPCFFSRSPACSPSVTKVTKKKKKSRKTEHSSLKKKRCGLVSRAVGSLDLFFCVAVAYIRDARVCFCIFRGQPAMPRPRNSEDSEAIGDVFDDASTTDHRGRRSLALPWQGLCSMQKRATNTKNADRAFHVSELLQIRRHRSGIEFELF